MATFFLDQAKGEADRITQSASAEVKAKYGDFEAEFERQTRERRKKITEQERRLINKEENLERRFQGMERRERDLSGKERRIYQREKDLDVQEEKAVGLVKKQMEELERISGLTQEEAKYQIIKKREDAARLAAVQGGRPACARTCSSDQSSTRTGPSRAAS